MAVLLDGSQTKGPFWRSKDLVMPAVTSGICLYIAHIPLQWTAFIEVVVPQNCLCAVREIFKAPP